MRFQVYRTVHLFSLRKEWRWRLRAANGKIIANSGEGYINRNDCYAAIELVKQTIASPVETRK